LATARESLLTIKKEAIRKKIGWRVIAEILKITLDICRKFKQLSI